MSCFAQRDFRAEPGSLPEGNEACGEGVLP